MPNSLITLILRVPGFLLAISIHEYAHARMAYHLGDDTADLAGRMTLEPWAHFDVVGALMLLIAGFGWAKPVPVDPYRLRNPQRDMAMIAVAGPVANFVMAFVLEVVAILLFTIYKFEGIWSYIPIVLSVGARINAGLGIFNLIPIPPLDGSRILEFYIPYQARHLWEEFKRHGFIILVALLMLGIVSAIMQPFVTGYIGFVQKVGLSLSSIILRRF